MYVCSYNMVLYCNDMCYYITTGLDSASSYELLTYLNRLAGSQRTVIMTIHQPRMEIFHMFTRLIMLCEGQVSIWPLYTHTLYPEMGVASYFVTKLHT